MSVCVFFNKYNNDNSNIHHYHHYYYNFDFIIIIIIILILSLEHALVRSEDRKNLEETHGRAAL
jgi:hypothetical protein